jgi:hypothetical protein
MKYRSLADTTPRLLFLATAAWKHKVCQLIHTSAANKAGCHCGIPLPVRMLLLVFHTPLLLQVDNAVSPTAYPNQTALAAALVWTQ